jgi:hypothetical protein
VDAFAVCQFLSQDSFDMGCEGSDCSSFSRIAIAHGILTQHFLILPNVRAASRPSSKQSRGMSELADPVTFAISSEFHRRRENTIDLVLSESSRAKEWAIASITSVVLTIRLSECIKPILLPPLLQFIILNIL